MAVRILHPYQSGSFVWLKGNLHAHTTESDGRLTPQALVDLYARAGYDFLMISDHDRVTALPSSPNGLLLISGNEVTANGSHILHVGAQQPVEPSADRQAVLDAVGEQGGFAIVCHPNWEREFNHCPQTQLESWRGYLGIEVYNGVVRRQYGSPAATDRWEQLLGKGRRVWGFANDDMHRDTDAFVAWNVVQAVERSVDAVLNALRFGAFYASTGVQLEEIGVEGDTILVRTKNAERIIVYSGFGHREATVDGREIRFQVPDPAPFSYVRFECLGPREAMAWTQPFFIEP
jgi:hypothetical protein